MDPVRAAGILLPILIVQDVVSVAAFRSSWDGRVLAIMLPGAVVGVVLGWWFAASVSSRAVLVAVGAISVLFGLYRLWVERGGRIAAAVRLRRAGSARCSESRPASPARSPMPAGRRSRCG